MTFDLMLCYRPRCNFFTTCNDHIVLAFYCTRRYHTAYNVPLL